MCPAQSHHQRNIMRPEWNQSLMENNMDQFSDVFLVGWHRGQLLLQWPSPQKTQGVCFWDRCIAVSVQSVQEELSFAGTSAGLNVRDSTNWKVHLTLKRSLGLVQYNQRRTKFPISDFCDPWLENHLSQHPATLRKYSALQRSPCCKHSKEIISCQAISMSTC